jgi:biopolymer transport protein ExbD
MLAREEAKQARQAAVEAIIVNVNGKRFNGDETSQTRMARAIVALDSVGQAETVWVLADNTAATVTRAELAQALATAGTEQTRLWVMP